MSEHELTDQPAPGEYGNTAQIEQVFIDDLTEAPVVASVSSGDPNADIKAQLEARKAELAAQEAALSADKERQLIQEELDATEKLISESGTDTYVPTTEGASA